MSESRSWEERYLEDVLPEIESYVHEETSGFTSSDIADRMEDYDSSLVGKTLKYVTDNDLTDHIIYTGNNPKTWEAILLNGYAWERAEKQLDVEPQEVEDNEESISDMAVDVMENHAETDYEELHRIFMSRVENHNADLPQKISTISETVEEHKPTVDREILDFDKPAYGKVRKHIDKVYEGLKKVKEKRSSFFDSDDIISEVEDARNSSIGVVIKGLDQAGLLEGYEDRTGYFPESIDLEEIREFKRAVKNADSLDDLRDLVDFRDEQE